MARIRMSADDLQIEIDSLTARIAAITETINSIPAARANTGDNGQVFYDRMAAERCRLQDERTFLRSIQRRSVRRAA